MTSKQYRKLKEASDELLIYAEMLKETVQTISQNLDQLGSDQNLIQGSAKKVYWAIESILDED